MSVTWFNMLHRVNLDVNQAAIVVSPRSQCMCNRPSEVVVDLSSFYEAHSTISKAHIQHCIQLFRAHSKLSLS